MAVIAALKLHQNVSPRVPTSQSDRAHDGLRAGGHEANLVHVSKAVFDPFGQFDFTEMRGTKRRSVQHFFVHGGDDLRV